MAVAIIPMLVDDGQDEYFSSVTDNWSKGANWVKSAEAHPEGSPLAGAVLLALVPLLLVSMRKVDGARHRSQLRELRHL